MSDRLSDLTTRFVEPERLCRDSEFEFEFESESESESESEPGRGPGPERG